MSQGSFLSKDNNRAFYVGLLWRQRQCLEYRKCNICFSYLKAMWPHTHVCTHTCTHTHTHTEWERVHFMFTKKFGKQLSFSSVLVRRQINYPWILLKWRFLRTEVGLRFCISNKLPGEAAAPHQGLRTTFWIARLTQDTKVQGKCREVLEQLQRGDEEWESCKELYLLLSSVLPAGNLT